MTNLNFLMMVGLGVAELVDGDGEVDGEKNEEHETGEYFGERKARFNCEIATERGGELRDCLPWIHVCEFLGSRDPPGLA